MATQRMQELLDEVAKSGRPVKIHIAEGGSPYPGLRQATIRNLDLVIIKVHSDDIDGACQIVNLPMYTSSFAAAASRLGASVASLFAPWVQYGAYFDAFQNEVEADLI